MTGMIGGFKSSDIESKNKVEPVTTNNFTPKRMGLDVNAFVAYSVVVTGTLTSNSPNAYTLTITGIEAYASKGDTVLIGANGGYVVTVHSVTTNTIVLAQSLTFSPNAGTTYTLFRVAPPRLNNVGSLVVADSGLATVIKSDALTSGGNGLGVFFYDQNAFEWYPAYLETSGRLGVTVVGSSLPTGAATEATLSALNAKVTACNTGAVVLAAGTAGIGKLTANSGVDIGNVGHNIGGPTSFNGTVTTAGTAVRYSASSIPCKRVSIMNPASSTAIIAVGGSTVSATSGSEVGWILNPGDGRSFDCSDVNQIYINADTNSARYIGDYS